MKMPDNEIARLARLRAYRISPDDFEREYRELVKLGALLTGSPYAAISLVEEHRVWFKATYGVNPADLPREHSVCASTILHPGPKQIEDLRTDPVYCTSPLVTGPPYSRAYLGVPLLSPEGLAIGALCVFDHRGRRYAAAEVEALESVARQVMAQLNLATANRALAASEVALRNERESFRYLLDDLRDVVFRADYRGNWTFLNPAWRTHLGHDPEGSLGRPVTEHVHPADRMKVDAILAELSGGTRSGSARVRFLAAEGTEKVFELFAKPALSSGAGKEITGTLTDLTALLSTHAQSTEREHFIESFYSSSPIVMGICEIKENDFDFISLNPAGFAMINATGRPLPIPAAANYPREAVEFWNQKFAECLAAPDKRLSFESNAGGPEDAWLRVFLAVVKDEFSGGNPRISFITADITEERRQRDALARQQKLLETVSEHAGDVIWMVDLTKNGDIVFINQAYERIFGQSCEDLLADRTNFLKPIHPEDRPRLIAALPSRNQEGYTQTYRVRSPAGERWVQDRAFPVRNAQGEVQQIVGIASDITESRSQAEALRREKETFEALLTHLPIGICLYDHQGLREYVNEEWIRQFGYSRAEVIGTPMPESMFANPAVAAEARAFRHRPGPAKEFEVRTKGGELKQFLVRAIPLPLDKTMTIIQDLSLARAQEKLIAEQRQTMVESARLSSLGEMAAGIAHEINNPLAIIQGTADLVLAMTEQAAPDPERIRKAMGRVGATVERIAKIIVGLKAFARDGSSDPFACACLSSIVGDALELCQTRFRNNGVELTLELAPPDTVPVKARSVQLAQLLVNLLNNAFDAVAEQATKRVIIRLHREGNRAILRVLDNGGGVPDDIKEKIMQPFFTTKAPGKGTGLGLSLSRAIVEAHGGRLSVRSCDGLTCFEVELPIDEPKKENKI